MNLLDRLLGHDAWTTRQLLLLCEPLSDEELSRPFDISHGPLRAIFAHVVRNIEAWANLLDGKPMESLGTPLPGWSIAEMIERLDCGSEHLALVARSVAEREAWDEMWIDPAEDPPI